MSDRERVEDAITTEIAQHYDYHPRMLAVHLLDSPAMRDLLAEAKADAWARGKHDEHTPSCRFGDGDCICPNPYRETSKEPADD